MAGSKVESGKVVKYIGTADRRVIAAKDWKAVGVNDQQQVVWDRSNLFTVPVADLKEGAVEYLDKVDAGFVVTDADVKG